jgi:hypothetical protein
VHPVTKLTLGEEPDAGRSAPMVLAENPEAMTGRGLSTVASVSRSWGVDARGGKVVWAELGATPADDRCLLLLRRA